MDVHSAFNTGRAGLQDASAQLSNASSRIAQAGSAETPLAEGQQTSGIDSPSAERASISITTEVINLKLAELQAKNSAKVIVTANDMVGCLIDTTA